MFVFIVSPALLATVEMLLNQNIEQVLFAIDITTFRSMAPQWWEIPRTIPLLILHALLDHLLPLSIIVV